MDLKKLEIGILFFVLVFNMFLVVYLLNPGFTGFAVFQGETTKLGSPGDFVSKKDINVNSSKILIDLDHLEKQIVLSNYDDSKSMFPLINNDSIGMGFRPDSSEEINIGDIISFWSFADIENKKRLVVHRVIDKGSDEKGIYFITKGDNNPKKDKQKVRFEEVDSVLIGILY